MKCNPLFCSVVALLSATLFAEEVAKPVDRKAVDPKARHAAMIARQGGELTKPGSYAGFVAIVNRQARLSSNECERVAKFFAAKTRRNFKVVSDAKGAKVVLTVVDEPSSPKVLLAPEDGWGKVNVADLVADLPSEEAKKKFFAIRARKLMIKAMSVLIGGGSSNYPGNITNASTVRQLDTTPDDLPVDLLQRYDRYLDSIGVTAKIRATYRKAVREGWAPAPTNDVQRKIWNDIRAIPTEPIRIKP